MRDSYDQEVVYSWTDFGHSPEDIPSKMKIIRFGIENYAKEIDGIRYNISEKEAIALYVSTIHLIDSKDLTEKFGQLAAKQYILTHMPLPEGEEQKLLKEIELITLLGISNSPKEVIVKHGEVLFNSDYLLADWAPQEKCCRIFANFESSGISGSLVIKGKNDMGLYSVAGKGDMLMETLLVEIKTRHPQEFSKINEEVFKKLGFSLNSKITQSKSMSISR